MVKKGLAVAIILLFIGVAFAPSINANVSKQDDMVEFDVEFCGLDKKHTVKLTQQESEEVEQLFDDIQDRLSNGDANEIFKDVVVELDKYGLLGGLSVKQVQKLVTSPYQRFQNNKFLQKIVNADKLDDNENYFCSIFGNITNACFYRIRICLMLHPHNKINPLQLFSSVSIGSNSCSFEGPSYDHPSDGHIWTFGLFGIKEWDGLLKGDIDSVLITIVYTYRLYFRGIKGFSGIQISLNDTTVFFGFARQVKIRNYW